MAGGSRIWEDDAHLLRWLEQHTRARQDERAAFSGGNWTALYDAALDAWRARPDFDLRDGEAPVPMPWWVAAGLMHEVLPVARECLCPRREPSSVDWDRLRVMAATIEWGLRPDIDDGDVILPLDLAETLWLKVWPIAFECSGKCQARGPKRRGRPPYESRLQKWLKDRRDWIRFHEVARLMTRPDDPLTGPRAFPEAERELGGGASEPVIRKSFYDVKANLVRGVVWRYYWPRELTVPDAVDPDPLFAKQAIKALRLAIAQQKGPLF